MNPNVRVKRLKRLKSMTIKELLGLKRLVEAEINMKRKGKFTFDKKLGETK